jgi:site-specific recombinase XerC
VRLAELVRARPKPPTLPTTLPSERSARPSVGRQLSPGSIRATLSALAYAHKLAGHAFDTAVFAKLMSGVARTHGGGKQGKAALETVELVRILDHLPDTLQGRRDRALLSLGFAAALRRSEFVGLDICRSSAQERLAMCRSRRRASRPRF